MQKYLLISMLAVVASSATAQIHQKKDSLNRNVYNINPIVVTGSGHHQRLTNTVTPVRVLSAHEMEQQGISTFSDAIVRMLPQVSMAPNSMGTFLRLNGLGNKYILILINGHKLTGDISNNVDISRIDLSRVKRIEVLDGAASSLYGSDAIGGVINIITDQPTDQLVAVTSNTRVSGEGQFTEQVNLDIALKNGLSSHTSFTHDEADSYQNNPYVYKKGSDTEVERTLAPLFTGSHSNLVAQRFDWQLNRKLAVNSGIDFSYRKTDRPNTREDITGGTDYEMRYKGLRWNVGGIYKFSPRNSVQADFTADQFRYGKEYDVAKGDYQPGDYVQSKKQHSIDGEVKGIFGFTSHSTTIFGLDARKDWLKATSGDVDSHVYTMAAYAQHEMELFPKLKAVAGLRLNYHETFHADLTPKLSIMYSPKNLNFRATYSRGFRAPGLDELYYHYYSVNRGKPQIIFGNKNLEAEHSDYFALGAEYHNSRLSVGVTGFINKISDQVVKDNLEVDDAALVELREEFPEMSDDESALLSKYARYRNSDKGEVKGLQVNATLNLFSGFSLSANYAYTYARTCTAGKWERMDRSILNSGTIAANYYHAFSTRYALNVNVNGRLQSKTYYSGYENAPGYGVWNLQTTHTLNLVKWCELVPSIGVDNIFDQVDDRIDSSLRKYALYSPGRMLVVGLKVKFKN